MRDFRGFCRRWAGNSVERTSNDVPSLDGTPRSSMFHAEERKCGVLPIAGLYRQEAPGFMWKNASAVFFLLRICIVENRAGVLRL